MGIDPVLWMGLCPKMDTDKLLFNLQHRQLGSPFGRAGTP